MPLFGRHRVSSGTPQLVDCHDIHSLYGIELVRMDDDHNAFKIERQARALLVQHDWDLDDLHLQVVGHRLAEALMRDDHSAYRHWHEAYSSAVRLAATDDPIVALRWLAEHPDLSIEDDQS
jgi:hypothetical protein